MALQKTSSAPEWKPVEEAAQFYDEAKWALKWGMLREAQAAADSSWALGKRDVDCASVRVESYLADFAVRSQTYLYEIVGDETGPVRKVSRTFTVIQPADPRRLETVLHGLNLYDQFLQTMPMDEPKLDSPWFQIGVSALESGSGVLQHFYFVPAERKANAEKLQDLRSLARSICARMLKSPSVREIYWLNGSTPSLDQFRSRLARRNFYRSIAAGARFWQETPEECITAYRELMSGDGYGQIRRALLERKLESPMVIAWNGADVSRLGQIWNGFLSEMESSTNLALRIEAKFQRFADANVDVEGQLEPPFEALCSMLVSNREEIIQYPFELFTTYDLHDLVSTKCSDVQNREKERIKERFGKVYAPQIDAMREEFSKNYWARMRAQGDVEKFAKQKEFLQKKEEFDSGKFSRVFSPFFKYSPTQAAELQPLVLSYKSNLVTQLETLPPVNKGRLRSAKFQVDRLEAQV
ncbi:MAG: hypothetical protein ABI042_09255, partial [Verrucomicrobiota bacterium]